MKSVAQFAFAFLCIAAPVAAVDVLPDTQPLTWDGDISLKMVDDLHAFADRLTAESVKRRERHWNRDFSTPVAYENSINPNRKRLAKLLGVNLTRILSVLESYEPQREVAMANSANPVHRVRWRCRDGRYGYGYRIAPSGGRRSSATAMVLVDSHLQPLDVQTREFPQRLTELGMEVILIHLIDRDRADSDVGAFDGSPIETNIPHREFIYRQAFEMGRYILGYEVTTVLGLVDALGPGRPVSVFGFGDGGEVALYAGAIDRRILGVGVCASFGGRQRLWEQPIDRNVWGILDEFGDAELAAMYVDRGLFVDVGTGFRYEPPVNDRGRKVAAPGAVVLPTEAQAAAELDRAEAILAPLDKFDVTTRAAMSNRNDVTGRPQPFDAFFQILKAEPADFAKMHVPFDGSLDEAFRKAWYGKDHDRRMVSDSFREMVEHTQALVRESEYVRKEWWAKADRASRDPEKWRESCEFYRNYLYDEVLGRFDYEKLPPNARTRKVFDEPTYTGYEVVLDVFGPDAEHVDVWAYGILLVPKGIAAGERRPVVVCQHGLEGRPQNLTTKGVDHYAYHEYGVKLAERGFVVFAPQNPYIGKNHFRQLVRKLYPLKKTLWSVIVPQHEQITDWLASLEFVDPERIGFYGLSYGGKTAMRVPALVDRYCLSICSGDFNEWIRKCTSVRDPFSYMGTGEYEMFEFDLGHTFNYAELAYLIAPRPFMVERGHRDGVGVDEWVAYEYAKVRLLYADLKIPERTEIEYFDGPHEIHGVGTFAFLHRHLNWPEPRQ